MEKDELNFPITIVSILIALMLSVGVMSSVGKPQETTTVADTQSQTQVQQQTAASSVPSTQQVAQTTTVPSTQTTAASTEATSATSEAATQTTASTTAQAPGNTLPSGAQEILSKYTVVVDKAKNEGPAFKKVEYQAIPEDKVNFEGGVFGKMLPLISNFLKTEEDAKANPEIWEKGNDMYWFPPYRVKKGCMLTDVSKIKSAECTSLDDGNVKITIVLNDEENSEPPKEGATSCDTAVGSMFSPIQRADIVNTLQTDPAVKFIVKDVDFSLIYHDCTAELVYNPENDQIVSLDQYMHISIDIKSGTIIGMSAVGTAELDNYLYLSDFAY